MHQQWTVPVVFNKASLLLLRLHRLTSMQTASVG